jgi:AcrR family transcriptional regulator
MARRTDHSRDELTEMLLASARRFAEKEGLKGIAARRIARDVGYTPGTIYNVFGSLDGLIVRLRADTLDELYERSADIPLDADAAENLRRLASAYSNYVLQHPNLWSVIFEHRPQGLSTPDWYREKVLRLMALVERAIASLFKAGDERRRMHEARVLWSSFHGIVWLEATSKLGGKETVQSLSNSLIDNYVYALAERSVRTRTQ